MRQLVSSTTHLPQTRWVLFKPLGVFGRAGVKSIINPLHSTVKQEMPSVSRLFGKMFSSVFSFTDSYEPVNF